MLALTLCQPCLSGAYALGSLTIVKLPTREWLDEAGARTTSDTFHDLYASQPEERLFSGGLESVAREELVRRSVGLLEDIVYWQEEGRHCWEVAGCRLQQEEDGLVTVEEWGGRFLARLSLDHFLA